MAQVINTNTISLNAQRNLGTSGASLATTIQRLSSGLRINSAKDDAAGLAISERFSTQIRGLDVAVRNANDGISLAQVAEGSLTEIGNNLQRIRELAVQSANATNSSSDRAALNAEVKQLTSEIDRVAKQADFNGTKLLEGSFSSQLFQVGANAGQAISIDKIVDARSTSLGKVQFGSTSGVGVATGTATGDGKVTGISITNPAGKTINIDDVAVKTGDTGAQVTAKIMAAINAKVGEHGVYAESTGTTGSYYTVGDALNSSGAAAGITVVYGTSSAAGITSGVGVTGGVPGAGEVKGLADLDVTTYLNASRAVAIVDKALTAVNSARADLGAVQNRFTSVVGNLQTSSENLAASRSRIRDTDFAKETAELTRTQILQQAGTAMLAQANQVPQNVLSLLR